MSILDANNEFSDAQAVTATAASDKTIDISTLLNATTNLGAGEPIWLVVQTQTAATDASSDATLTVTLESADDKDLTTNAVVHASSGALAFADFSPAGSVLLAVPLPSDEYKAHLGVRYTVASGPLTAGKFDAFLTRDPQQWRAYANHNVV